MIYCVEDDESIRELIVYTLRSSGFEALGLSDGASLAAAMQEKTPSLILLDIMMPGEDGLSIMRRLRKSAVYRNIPIILVTAKSAEYDKIRGLDGGADDYITKPFGMMELVSRIRAVLRRSAPQPGNGELSCGGVRLNSGSHTVTVNGEKAVLTYKEFELLKLFMEEPDRVFTRDILLERLWGYEFGGETRTVDVHIRTLRQKLGDEARIIETVRGVGYKLGGRK